MAVSTFFAQTVAVITISLSALNGGTGDVDRTIRIEVPIQERYAPPLPPLPELEDFRRAIEAPNRFELATPPRSAVEAALCSPFAVGNGPGRATVTPGRSSAPRDSVPVRSRRKLRVWERDSDEA